ncbi:MAG: arsenate reductase [Chloroflexi bacterium]|nr:arsenate reductase [Chloroflexota bacterium]
MVAAGRATSPTLGVVTAPSVSAQVFGTNDSQPTRAALRFFKERRVAVHFVDLRRKPIAAGELRRFVERLGAMAVADIEGRVWRNAGHAYLRMDEAELVERLLADQRLLRLPLVRVGNGVAAGRDEAAWKRLLGGPA